jgi:magnesium transporter
MGKNRLKMLRHMKPRIRRRLRPGAKPGTIAIQPGARPTTIRVMAYDKDRVLEIEVDEPRELQELLAKWPVVWVDVVGLGTEEKLHELARIFHIHPLALEDVVHIYQRAKVDQYDQNLFIVMRITDPSEDEQLTEQFTMILGKNYLVTFQERPGDCFDLVRAGIRVEQSMSRQGLKPDYLAYRLIDAALDAYFPVLEAIGDHLDQLDDPGAIAQPTAFSELHGVRRQLLMLRRAIWPLRDAISELRSEVTPYVCDETRIYLRDCYDHAVQLIDLLESYRDIAGDVRDYYLSSISNRMNEIMKTLTVIATIFLPLSFITGVYGMNFHTDVSPWNMPELNWRFGYLFAWGLIITVAVGMLWNFKARGWLRSGPMEAPLEAKREELHESMRE